MFECTSVLRTIRGPVIGLVAQVLLLTALARSVGLGSAALVAGAACAVTVDGLLALGLLRDRSERLGPAGCVTMARATLAVGVAALTVDSFEHDTPVATLVALSTAALVLDYVDGRVARRTGTASGLGARFDGEVDAFLILALSVYVAQTAGAWVLLIGAARYAFLVAGWLLGWMRATLPPREWRKVVAATQGVTLTIAAAGVLPAALTRIGLAVALALLAESFGRDVWWLWRHRHEFAGEASPETEHGRVRLGISAVLTVLAFMLVWAALVAPHEPSRLTLGAFLRLPLEGVILVALALVLPGNTRRILAWVVGPVIGLLILVKILDFGFFTAFDRPFDPGDDWSYTHTGIETLRHVDWLDDANVALVGVALAGRGRRRPAHPGPASPDPGRGRPPPGVAPGGRGAGRGLGAVLGAGRAVRVRRAHRLHQRRRPRRLRGARGAGRHPGSVASSRGEIRHDRYRPHAGQPAADRPARQGRPARVRRELRQGRGPGLLVLAAGRRRPRRGDEAAAGRRLRRPQRLAHLADLRRHQLAGALHDAVGGLGRQPAEYDQLVASDRLTLSQAFGRAGWRTVDDVPSDNRYWPEGSSFYHYDKVYDRLNVGYRGPTYAYASMPDQYVCLALQRLELAKADRRPLFAEVDLVSSHEPWTQIPPLIAWNAVGDGSIFNTLPVDSHGAL